MKTSSFFYSAGIACLHAFSCGISRADETPGATKVSELLRQPDAFDPLRETILVRLNLPPGATSKPHRHPGSVTGYVVSGEFDFQVAGQPLQHLKAGDHFYEAPGAEHLVSRNPSTTKAAEVIVFMVQPKHKPLVLPGGTSAPKP
jgi:quercetin dioxygenase-like cupin family protein